MNFGFLTLLLKVAGYVIVSSYVCDLDASPGYQTEMAILLGEPDRMGDQTSGYTTVGEYGG